MLRSCRPRFGIGGLVLLLLAATLHGLEPPTAEQIRQYQSDGTWAERVARAHQIGNDRVDPVLIARARHRLQTAALAAAGIKPNPADLPQSAPPLGWQGGLPTKGNPKVLVLLIDFPDYPATADQTAADVENKLFNNGDAAQYPYESLRNYYQRASYDQLTIQGDVLGWFHAPDNRSTYAKTTAGREGLIMEALNYFDAQGHDFTQYDNDGNGVIDALFVKWTGPDAGWASFWWAYQTGWSTNLSFTIDGKKLGAYVWSWIANTRYDGLAVYQPHVDIHETGHLLGLPDYYDYDSTVGPRGGLGGLDMMDSNLGDHNCFSKFILDWLTPTTIISGTQTTALNPSGTSKDCVVIMPGVAPGSTFDEFFMAQYRKRSAGNDKYLQTDGYLIWHIDSHVTPDGYDYLYDNSYTARKLIRLMEADGLEQIQQGLPANAGDYYTASRSFGPATTPNSRQYSGRPSNVQIDQLSAAGSTMSGRFAILPRPVAIASSATLTFESCQAGNQAIDPGETATVDLALSNVGTASSSHLVATLQSTGGVSLPSAPQDYGAIPLDGSSVSRPFTFTAGGTCGGTATATLLLQDGDLALDPVNFTFHLGKSPLDEEFDGVTAPALPSGWSATSSSVALTPWATSSAQADSEANSVFSTDPAFIADNRLESPPIAITSPTAQLSFRHNYALETGYDGGVLEIAIGAGAFTDILAAGGSFVTRGYDAIISVQFESPIKGRSAWTGNSGGFVTTTVNLPPVAAGQTIKLRWRMGSDLMVSSTGWYVDSAAILNDSQCCDALAAPSLGDFDGDGDVDQVDFGRMQECFSGPGAPQLDVSCLPGRMDADADIDQDDLDLFAKCHGVSNVPADPHCRSQ